MSECTVVDFGDRLNHNELDVEMWEDHNELDVGSEITSHGTEISWKMYASSLCNGVG